MKVFAHTYFDLIKVKMFYVLFYQNIVMTKLRLKNRSKVNKNRIYNTINIYGAHQLVKITFNFNLTS